MHPVTIIVPIYGGLAYTARCLDSVARHAATARVPFELLLIDDASPDRPVRELVDEFASTPAPFPITALHNDENLGFVATVNRGLRLAPGDVVILNSDTAVTDGLARPPGGSSRASRRRDGHAVVESRVDLHAARIGDRGVRARNRESSHRRVRGVRRGALARGSSRRSSRAWASACT